mmetsp:Transcript_153478/g.491920  ORF Transcript_153478/g.491920 Transcript_153478/m.491920 type:complete len:226 (+) Transcript_153478:8-685(+)
MHGPLSSPNLRDVLHRLADRRAEALRQDAAAQVAAIQGGERYVELVGRLRLGRRWQVINLAVDLAYDKLQRLLSLLRSPDLRVRLLFKVVGRIRISPQRLDHNREAPLLKDYLLITADQNVPNALLPALRRVEAEDKLGAAGVRQTPLEEFGELAGSRLDLLLGLRLVRRHKSEVEDLGAAGARLDGPVAPDASADHQSVQHDPNGLLNVANRHPHLRADKFLHI